MIATMGQVTGASAPRMLVLDRVATRAKVKLPPGSSTLSSAWGIRLSNFDFDGFVKRSVSSRLCVCVCVEMLRRFKYCRGLNEE